MLVVIGILMLLVQIGLFLSFDFYRTYAFTSVRSETVTTLYKARSRAMANINQSPHGVKVLSSPTSLVIFQGSSYATRDTSKDEVIFPSSLVTISGMTEVVFSQISANATVTGGPLSFSLGPKNGNLSINQEGLIIW